MTDEQLAELKAHQDHQLRMELVKMVWDQMSPLIATIASSVEAHARLIETIDLSIAQKVLDELRRATPAPSLQPAWTPDEHAFQSTAHRATPAPPSQPSPSSADQ